MLDIDKIFEEFYEDETEYSFNIGDTIKSKCKLDYWSPGNGRNGGWSEYAPGKRIITDIKNAVDVKKANEREYNKPILDRNDNTKICEDTLFMIDGCWCWFALDEDKIEKV